MAFWKIMKEFICLPEGQATLKYGTSCISTTISKYTLLGVCCDFSITLDINLKGSTKNPFLLIGVLKRKKQGERPGIVRFLFLPLPLFVN